jgi:hypothetical protein
VGPGTLSEELEKLERAGLIELLSPQPFPQRGQDLRNTSAGVRHPRPR